MHDSRVMWFYSVFWCNSNKITSMCIFLCIFSNSNFIGSFVEYDANSDAGPGTPGYSTTVKTMEKSKEGGRRLVCG